MTVFYHLIEYGVRASQRFLLFTLSMPHIFQCLSNSLYQMQVFLRCPSVQTTQSLNFFFEGILKLVVLV